MPHKLAMEFRGTVRLPMAEHNPKPPAPRPNPLPKLPPPGFAIPETRSDDRKLETKK